MKNTKRINLNSIKYRLGISYTILYRCFKLSFIFFELALHWKWKCVECGRKSYEDKLNILDRDHCRKCNGFETYEEMLEEARPYFEEE